MPKLGMEPVRRAALIDATIAEIGQTGTLDITVGQIAARAGMSSALAHHYFGGKDQIFLAAMRHTLRVYSAETLSALKGAETPIARLHAIIESSFAPSNFRAEVITSWLNFYVLARSSDAARRLLNIYHARLRSNLLHDLRPLAGSQAPRIAAGIAALIDGAYLHQGLGQSAPCGRTAAAHVTRLLDLELAQIGSTAS